MGLEIDDVRHSFGDRLALDGVSFDVVPGVITGLLGPNGAGKTTLLRVMLGVLSPDRGEVRYDGRPVGEEDRRQWGYMPQERGLYPGMPAGDQVAYFGRLHGLSRREATSRAHALLEELGLEDRWSDRTDKLSGGMQQRLQLATSLVHDPVVIVLDEPFNGLDPVAVASLSETLRQRARDGRTVLFSSHQLDLVQDLCEDIAMVDHGRTVLLGSVARVAGLLGPTAAETACGAVESRLAGRIPPCHRGQRPGRRPAPRGPRWHRPPRRARRRPGGRPGGPVSYTHLRAHETVLDL